MIDKFIFMALLSKGPYNKIENKNTELETVFEKW
jgi:hypothetical protein